MQPFASFFFGCIRHKSSVLSEAAGSCWKYWGAKSSLLTWGTGRMKSWWLVGHKPGNYGPVISVMIVMAREKRLKILKHIGILENIGIKSSLNIGMYENKGSPDHPCDFSSTKLESWFMPEVWWVGPAGLATAAMVSRKFWFQWLLFARFASSSLNLESLETGFVLSYINII